MSVINQDLENVTNNSRIVSDTKNKTHDVNRWYFILDSHNLLALWKMEFDYNMCEYNLAFLCAAKTFQGADAIWSNSNRPLPNDSRQEIRPPHLKLVASDMRA